MCNLLDGLVAVGCEGGVQGYGTLGQQMGYRSLEWNEEPYSSHTNNMNTLL